MEELEASASMTALDNWQAASSQLFYSLADRTILERGIHYFERGLVDALGWMPKQHRWQAVVCGSKDYRVWVKLHADAIEHHCNCPAHRDAPVCKHVVAVVALLYFLSKGKRFGYRLPAESYLRRIREELTAPEPDTSEVSGPKIARKPKTTRKPDSRESVILVTQGPHGVPIAEVEGHVPEVTLRHLGFQRLDWNQRSPMQRIFWGTNLALELAKLAVRAGDFKIPVQLVDANGKRHPVKGELHKISTHYQIHFNRQSDQVELHRFLPDLPKQKVLDLNKTTILSDNGDLFEVIDSQRNTLVNMADPSWDLDPYNSFSVPYGPLPSGKHRPRSREAFNTILLAVPFSSFAKNLAHTPLFCDGQALDPDSIGEPTTVSATVNIESEKQNAFVHAHLRFQADETELPIDGPLLDALHRDLSGQRIDERLLRAKGRLKVLLEAVQALALITDKRERNRIIKEASSDKVFQQLRLKAKAKRWLEMIERDWFKTRSKHLLAHTAAESGWILCESAHPLLLRLILGLVPFKDHVDLVTLSTEIMVPRVELAAFIQRASLVCAALNVPLRYNDAQVKSLPVELSLEAEQTADIDWFELKAEIRCGELTIPEAQWDALIRGELLLEHEGTLLVPELSQVEALARLRALFGQPKRGKGSGGRDQSVMQTPRLQMLDWLELRQAGVKVKLPAEAERVWISLLEFTQIPRQPLPEGIHAKLRSYQQRGFEWMAFLYEHRFGACLADDMGLGKTLQAIAFLAWVKASTPHCGPFLIVVPPSLIFNWRDEIERFCPSLSVHEYISGERDLDVSRQADVILTTYDLVRRDIDSLKGHTFEVVIFDEVQALKNISAVRTKAAVKLKRRFSLCLTGTPMENHAGEYYSIMNLATPGIFGNYADFRRSLREGEAHLLRRARPFMLRRTKDAILKDLPPKIESEVHLDMTPEQKEIYTRTVGEVRAEVLEAYRDKPRAQAGIVALAALTRLRQVCISPELLGKPIRQPAPKIDYLLGKMRELLDEGHSALLFSQFTRTLDLLEDAAVREGIEVLRLDGQTPVKTRKKRVEAFQKSDEPQLFLISLKAGGAGLNLTRAQYVFHIDPWWNPAVENQASDRAHRIGQTQTVFIQRLLMRHSVEEKIMQLKQRKQKLFEAIVESSSAKASSGTLVTKDDFEFLLGPQDMSMLNTSQNPRV